MTTERKLHPRPQFIRENWHSLEGQWDFKFDDENEGVAKQWCQGFEKDYDITVPFTYETRMSGIHQEEHHPVVWYQRGFEAAHDGQMLTLYFEGVDYETTVWVNGSVAGTHRGASERFSFDISSLVKAGANQIVLRAEDSMDCEQPRGK